MKKQFNDKLNEKDLNEIFNKNYDDISNDLDFINKEYNNDRLQLNSIDIKEENINNKIEEKIECEERLKYLENKKEELESLSRSIELAKDVVDDAYGEMKDKITPKFTKELSGIIEKISSGKYKKANFDIDKGLIVEKEDGEYINCNKLSIGTIDQLYLSLRLSVMDEISEEKMPIILDEAFAFFDNERLNNILQFITNNYKENQIIIFTCTAREKDILDKLKIKYNLVEL